MTRLTVTVLIVLATSITNLTVTAHQAAAADESGQWQDDVELIAAEDAPEEEQDEQEEDESQDEQEEDESQDDDDDVELIAVEAEPDDQDEDEQEQEEQDEQEDDESQDDDDDVELLAAKADPDEEDEEEQEQQEQEEYEDDESQDDVELLAAKSKGKVKKAATKAKKAVKKAKKAAKKAKKAVKKPKKKKKKVSKIAKGKYAKFLVLKGSKEKTIGGLTAKDLIKNKYGRTVSKKKAAIGKKHPWMAAVAAARSALKIKGFSLIKKGSPLYAKAKSLYKPKEEMLSADVISGTAAALMGLFVGFGLGFIVLRSRRRVPAELCEPMLPSA